MRVQAAALLLSAWWCAGVAGEGEADGGGGYSVLAVFPSLERTGHLVYAPLLRELARRGHAVTLLGHYPLAPPRPPRYTHVQLAQAPARAKLSFQELHHGDAARVLLEGLVAARAGHEECAALVDHPEVRALVASRARFDVALVESDNSDCGFALAHNLSAPAVALVPGALRPWQRARLGLAPEPAARDAGLLERALRAVLARAACWTHYLASQVPDRVLLYARLGDALPPLETLAANASAVLLNAAAGVAGAALWPDHLELIAGIHLPAAPSQPHPLPEEVERVLAGAVRTGRGAVYISLGSTFSDASLDPAVLEQLLDELRALQHVVLWRFDVDSTPGLHARLPNNVYAAGWFPQYDILTDGRVAAFVSQCGVLSAWEAVSAGVPLVCVPLAGDQPATAAALADAGVALLLPFPLLHTPRLRHALREISRPRYKARSREVARWWADRARSPLAAAAWHTERVARLRGPGRPGALPPPPPLDLDLLLFLTASAALLLYFLLQLFLCVCCCRCLRGRGDRALTSDSAPATSVADKRVKFE